MIWIEDLPLTEDGEKIAEILKGKAPMEIALIILHVLSKGDNEVLRIIRSRNMFELRRIVRKSMEKCGVKGEEAERELFTDALWHESDEYMKKYFPEECE